MYKSFSVPSGIDSVLRKAVRRVAEQSKKGDLRFILRCVQQLNKLRILYHAFIKQRQLESRMRNVHRPGYSMGRNLIMQKNYCDKRLLDCVINLIPDPGLKSKSN